MVLSTVANLLFFTTVEASLCRAAFVFVLKLKVNTDLELLLSCSYLKFRLLTRIQC